MKNFKRILISIPEYYLIALVLLAGFTPPFSFNPISIGLAFLVILQIIYKNKGIGLIIGGLVILISLFMILPLLSELSEFRVFNGTAAQLLIGGLSLIILNLFARGLMIHKYQFEEHKVNLVSNQ